MPGEEQEAVYKLLESKCIFFGEKFCPSSENSARLMNMDLMMRELHSGINMFAANDISWCVPHL